MAHRSKTRADVGKRHDPRTPREKALGSAEGKLRRLATMLRTAARRVDLAATYAGDGAIATAEAITVRGRPRERDAASMVDEVSRSLHARKWQR